MKHILTIKCRNREYDKEYANEYHGGRESDGNRKIMWSRSHEINGIIKDINISLNESMYVELIYADKTINALLQNLCLIEFYLENGTKDIYAVSNDIIFKKPTILRNNTRQRVYVTVDAIKDWHEISYYNGVYVSQEVLQNALQMKS
jgi:hypothetical protein